jgi:SAM-dependent methyltransferase
LCPSCHAAGWTEIQGADTSFQLLRCAGCGCVRIVRPPAGAGVYDRYYSEQSAQRVAGIFNVIWRWKRRSRAALILRHTQGRARVCDVGCERGELLNVLREGGCAVVGTQMAPAAAEFARRQFGIEVFLGELMDAPFAGDRFDAVLMLNVLEHLPDPEAYVAQASKMLERGGLFWIELPNIDSFTARMAGKSWLHHDPPHHLWGFTRAGIARLLGRHGFAVDHVYSHNWEFGPIGTLQAWLNWLPGPRNVLYDIVRRGLSRDLPSLALELTHVVVGGLLLPFAFVVAGLEGAAGNGQVLLMRARKS